MSAPTVILLLIKRYIRIFREAGATNPANAIVPGKHGIRTSMVFKKLVRQGVLVQVGNEERYYLDEVQEAMHRKRRLVLAGIVIAVVLAGLLIAYFSGQL